MTAPSYSEHDVDESVIADIGLDRPELLAETARATCRRRRENRVVRRSRVDCGALARCCSPFTSAAWVSTGRRSASFRRSSRSWETSPSPSRLAYFVIVPVRLFTRRVTRCIERAAWQRVLDSAGDRACGLAAARDPLVARVADAIRHPLTLRPLLAAVGVWPRSPDRIALGGGHRRLRPDLGYELVLRHRELGGRHLELVGRVAHRHVARGDGARGRRLRPDDARRPRLHGDAAESYRHRALFVRRDRRHGGRRRQSAGAEGLAAARRRRRRCAIRRALPPTSCIPQER